MFYININIFLHTTLASIVSTRKQNKSKHSDMNEMEERGRTFQYFF